MESPHLDKFIEIQLRQCGYEQYVPLFKGMPQDKFLSLGYNEIRDILPNDPVAQAKIFLHINDLAEVHIVDEVIKGDFQLINDSSIKVEEEDTEASDGAVSTTGVIKRRKVKVEPESGYDTETIQVETEAEPVVSNMENVSPIINISPPSIVSEQDQVTESTLNLQHQPQTANDITASNSNNRPPDDTSPTTRVQNQTGADSGSGTHLNERSERLAYNLRSKRVLNQIFTCNFEFNRISKMNAALNELRKARKFQGLKELALNTDETHVLMIGREQMKKILDLPQLITLTTLEINVGLSQDLLPSIELLLTRTTSLENFFVKHGFLDSPGPDTEKLLLRLPKMPELNEFVWGADYRLSTVVQTRSNLIDLDEEDDDDENGNQSSTSTTKNKRIPITILIDFTDITFKKLTVLNLGVTVGVKGMNINQLPNVSDFSVQSFWDPLIVFPEGCSTNSISTINFPVGISDTKHVELVIKNCPQLRHIFIECPTTECLRTLVRLINGSAVTHLTMWFGYEFECALSTVFLGTPYVARTLADKQKLKKLKEYKFWEKFVRHFKIEVPGEEEDENAGTQQRYGISGVTQLKQIELIFEPKCIFMPSGDKLWSDLDFELSDERLSFSNYPFSSEVLLEEFSKLKELNRFLYTEIEISEEDLQRFELKMNFAPVEIPFSPTLHEVDQKDSLTNSISVKEEKK